MNAYFWNVDYHILIDSIQKKNLQQIYLLHGEEPYFIDLISNAVAEYVLDPSERDFNQTILYGKEVDALNLVSQAKQFPMMSERQVIIVKEAQDIKNWDLFESYFEHPQPSTVLVFCHKYKKIDGRKKVFKTLLKNGLIFQSDKLKDYQLPDWIQKAVTQKGYSISDKAANLLAEFLGNDLGRIVNELDKLAILLEKGTKINDVHIEENIGISKDYNVFELVNAIAERNPMKAQKIIHYFAQNPKAANIVVVVSSLFGFFQRLMSIHFLPSKSESSIASVLKVHPYVAKQLLQQSSQFPPKTIARNIQYLKEYDLKSKGLGSSTEQSELMRELIFLLLH